VLAVYQATLSWRDIFLVAGGLFLITKATREIHREVEPGENETAQRVDERSLWAVIAQLALIDLVFSVDSIITAVGLVDRIEVMVAAIVISVIVMFAAAKPVGAFIEEHPTTKMLALAFLLMIGAVLLAMVSIITFHAVTSIPPWPLQSRSKS
jgi:predicted tellurium resistance membrane protein TerC